MTAQKAREILQNDLDRAEKFAAKEYGWSPRTFEVGELIKETAHYYAFSTIVDGKSSGNLSGEAVLKADGRTGAYPFPQIRK